MENEEANSRGIEYSAFGEQARQETETVLRRSGGESLDDYLQNVSAYLDDLNRRLGVKTPPAEEPQPLEAGEESGPAFAPEGAPEAADDGVPGDVSFARAQEELPPETYEPPETYAPPEAYEAAPEAYEAAPEAYEQPEVYPPPEAYAPYAAAPEGIPYREELPPETPPYGSGPYDAEPAGYGYSPGDWQSAVAYPELYPDLNDPQVTGRKTGRGKRGGEKRPAKKNKKESKKESRKEKRRQRKSAPATVRGNVGRFSFVTTLLNLGLYGGWLIAYFISLGVRSAMFTSAQAEMAAQGVANYSVTISSPVFTVLKLLMYAMPVVLLLWMKGVLSADKKGLEPPDKKWLIAAFAVDLIAGFVVIFDVLAAQLVFGA